MNLLYDLPVELQQAILAQALHMHLHSTPEHKMLDDRQFFHWYTNKTGGHTVNSWCRFSCEENERVGKDKGKEADACSFMEYVLGIS